MTKIILSLLSFILLSMALHAQNPIAQLKFEDAEKAFNAGDYEKALRYVSETEKLAGVTSKTLYLKIVTQDKLVAGGQLNLLSTLKTNVQKYLTAMASQEIDDKYRNVYEISKRADDYKAKGVAALSASNSNDITFTQSNKSVSGILAAYKKAVIGNVNPASIHSMIMEIEMVRNGKPFSTSTLKQTKEKYCMTMTMGSITTKIVYSQGKGYIAYNGRKIPMTSSQQLDKYSSFTLQENIIKPLIAPEEYPKATAGKGIFNGESIDIIKLPGIEYYFDPITHLLIAKKTTNDKGLSSTNTFQDYTSFQGIKFPVTTTAIVVNNVGAPATVTSTLDSQKKNETENYFSTAAATTLTGNRKKKRKKTADNSAAMGLMVRPRKKKTQQGASIALVKEIAGQTAKSIETPTAGNTTTLVTKIISVKINEPIDDDEFK